MTNRALCLHLLRRAGKSGKARVAFDVQGGVYPIRESVFKASYRRSVD